VLPRLAYLTLCRPIQLLALLRTPLQAPNANAFAERWIATARPSAWTDC
jgi:hypothetical protein